VGCRIFPSSNKKKNYEIWLILEGDIVISAECIFEDKMASVPGALSRCLKQSSWIQLNKMSINYDYNL